MYRMFDLHVADGANLAAVLLLAETRSLTSSPAITAVLDMQMQVLRVQSRSIQVQREIDQVRQDKRRGSVLGRKRRIRRLPCRWPGQYFGSPLCPPIYNDRHFRDTFGVPKGLFRNILDRIGSSLTSRPAADGRPPIPPDVQLLTTLRILRTGSAMVQFDDQSGMGLSTIREKFR